MAKKTAEINQPDVSGFDFDNLKGDDLQKYLDICAELKTNELYDWELWKASSIYKFRTNEDTGQPEQYLSQIVRNGSKPVMRTRVTPRTALELNRQIEPDAKYSNYYFLAQKKEEK